MNTRTYLTELLSSPQLDIGVRTMLTAAITEATAYETAVWRSVAALMQSLAPLPCPVELRSAGVPDYARVNDLLVEFPRVVLGSMGRAQGDHHVLVFKPEHFDEQGNLRDPDAWRTQVIKHFVSMLRVYNLIQRTP